MAGDRETRAPAGRLDRRLEALAGEGREPVAALADEVVMVRGGIHALVAGRVATDLDPLDQLQLLQLVEGAVDAGPPDRLDATVDLQRGQRALGAAEQLDHLAAGVAAAVSGFVEPFRCVGGPIQAREAIRE